MKDWEKDLNILYQLLEQEISNYHQLIQEMKTESKCLREGNTESLIQSVKAIDNRIKTIRMIEEEIQRSGEHTLHGLGKAERNRTLSCLSSLLPPPHQSRLSFYQKTISQLKEWVRQLNDQNAHFIKEHLVFLSELISPWAGHPNESTGYPGHKRPFALSPCALNREV